MPFIDSLDIANRALQHCGAPQLTSVTEDSKANEEVTFAYDKVRRAELRRNNWRFAIRRAALRAIDTTTLFLDPPVYSSAATYLLGDIVKDTNNQFWVSLKPDNVNNTPGGNNDYWDAYFGPRTASLWTSGTSYFAGELVYMAGTYAGSYQVYVSLTTGNTDEPDIATAWDSLTTYYADQVVSYGGSQWRSLLPYNVGTTPADGPASWDATATYSTSQQVTGSDHFIYTSVGNGNIGNDPTTDGGTHWTNTHTANAWSRTPTVATSAKSWNPIGSQSLKALPLLYPIGSGPSSNSATRNVFALPCGYLRTAPNDPKAGATSYLGAPSGLLYNDWLYEGDFIVSACASVIVLRFVADVTVVSEMDDMFCEGLACRIAEAICEPLTNSTGKLKTIIAEYNRFMGEARIVNAIEIGSEEPPIDDFIACRA